ncbi:Stp1/IreP family PP2C-type Ser/Thr phosphatase [Aliikangiella sp. IMCC44359]|uniref:Stp1/IreP family PP2C-type Ser/Thr phosphatase n=1 Tax=Aliikangiella sp. IMCC44359 TaxID=3459125 RepID=UPI00403ADAFC
MENTKINNKRYAQATDVGCVRELNEDSLFCNENLWLVADGMGGHACGEVASGIATETIAREFMRTGDLVVAIERAHHNILDASKSKASQQGMGTTVVALTGDSEKYFVAWVGDSRAYLWDHARSRLAQISEDHSLIVRLVKSGLISAEEAQKHPQRHMITQCLGSVEIEQVNVDSYQDNWQANQQILLCSDGLTDELSDSDIAQILKNNTSKQTKLERLVEAAKKAGGKDNISVVLVDSPVADKPTLWTKLRLLFKF